MKNRKSKSHLGHAKAYWSKISLPKLSKPTSLVRWTLVSAAGLLCVASLTACQKDSSGPVEPVVDMSAFTPLEAHEEITHLGSSEDAEHELAYLGYCKDDIYSQYLISEYKKTVKKKRFKTSKSRRAWERKVELDGIHYAARTLDGPASPHFGAIPVVTNSKVEFWIRYFKTSGRSSFLKWLVRGESTRHLVDPILIEEGLPREFFYLAMIESGFSNIAASKASATGTWQFMSATAKVFGLRINYWLDERRDPLKSTVAASQYLKRLYGRFGDWYLAMAAYNAGPGTVNRAIRKSKSRDFWEISETKFLPQETKDYVPKMLAALILSKNPERHGFEVKKDPAKMIPEEGVVLDKPVDLREVSKKLDLSLKSIKYWNPELRENITPPQSQLKEMGGSYYLRLPPEYVERFEAIKPQLALIEVKDIHLHMVNKGDTLYAIARKYRVSVKKILKLNPSLSPRTLRIGKQIAVPVPSITTRQAT